MHSYFALARAALAVIGMICASPVHAQSDGASTNPFPSEKQQACNLLIGIVAASAYARDNYVAPSVPIGNLEDALRQLHTPYSLWGEWHQEIWNVYGSKMTPERVEERLRPRCH